MRRALMGSAPLRIHVDRERRLAVRAVARHRLDRLAHRRDRHLAVRRPDHELRAVALLAAEQRRRAEHRHLGALHQRAHRLRGRDLGAGLDGRADYADQLAVRWIRERLPTSQLTGQEAG